MIEEVFASVVRAAVEPLARELRGLRAEIERLRHAVPPQIVSIRDAAAFLGLSESTIRRRIKTGDIPYQRIGALIRIDLGALRPKSPDEISEMAHLARSNSNGGTP